MQQIDAETGEITLGYDTTRLQDFGDFVNAGFAEVQKRDRSTWALGDIAAAFEVRVGRPEKKKSKAEEENDPTPTLTNLATAWGVNQPIVTKWRANSEFWDYSCRNYSHGNNLSWRDTNEIRQYVAWEFQGEKDIEVKRERGVEILEEVVARALRGVALEKWLKDKRREINNSLPLPPGKYQVIYADPPWEYQNSMPEEFKGQQDHYRTMTVAEIAAMPIQDLATDNAVLFLWVTSPILEESFEVVHAWGFEYKASFVWNKDAHVMAHYNSARHELLLVCVRGSFMPTEPNRFGSVITIKRSDEHSEKPVYFREMIEQLYPAAVARVELFARERTVNWEGFGNELS